MPPLLLLLLLLLLSLGRSGVAAGHGMPEVSLAHIKAKDEEKPKPRRIAHHGGAVTTNKPVALLQFLHKKKLKGETLSEEQ